VQQRLAEVRARHDDMLHTGDAAQRFADTLQAMPEAGSGARTDAQELRALARQRSLLLREGRALLTTVGNQSNLILDPDLDSYYVMSLVVLRFPEMLQAVHDTVSFLDASPARRGPQWSSELLTLAGRLDAVMLGVESDYDQAFIAGSPDLRASQTRPREALRTAVAAFEAQLQDVAAGESRLGVAQASAQHARVLEALRDAWGVGIHDLEGLLLQRVDRLFARMWLHLGTALALLGCILGLVTLVARQIAKPLQHLARVADEVRRSGDHTLRASWASRDEIGRLVTAFNDMLAQLDRERLLQQELAASARAA
jgi:HAMP domain-containing protein